MVDPIQSVLNQGGGILARRIVNTLLPNADNVVQEMAIEILTRGFRHTTNVAWNQVRTDLVNNLQSVLIPRLGEERTNTFIGGVQTQVNRVARENNIQFDDTNWIGNQEAGIYEDYFRRERNTYVVDNQGQTYNYMERANEYAERQEMDAEDEASYRQQQIDISNELFAGMFISQFAPWKAHLTKLLKQQQKQRHQQHYEVPIPLPI